MFSEQAPASVAASGCAPPMPPRPAVYPAAFRLPGSAGDRLRRRFVGTLHDATAADVIQLPAVIWPYIASPLASSSLKCSRVAQCGTGLELAISTRGEFSWV